MGTGLHPLNLTMKPQINPTSSEEAFTHDNTAQAHPNASNRPRPKLTLPESASVGSLGPDITTTGRAQDAEHEGPKLPAGALLDEIRTPLSFTDSSIGDHVQASTFSSCITGSHPCSSLHDSASTITTNASLVSGVGAGNKSNAQTFETRDELNWCDCEEVEANADLLDWGPRRYLRIAETKRNEYPDGFDKGNYFENLNPIIASDYVRAEKIVCCGRPFKGFNIPCDQWPLCSKCAFMKGVFASQMYEGTFNKTPFFHLTLGFDGDIPFDVTNCVDAQAYWKTNEAAVSHLLAHDLIEGAYSVHELKIRSFLPLRVNPHTHVIVAAPRFDPSLIPALTEMIGGAAGVDLKPSIHVRLIENKSDHVRCLRYLTKAVDLQEPYLSAWNQNCGTDRKMAPALNLEMKVFLDAQAAAFGGMNRIVRLGNLMPQRKSFIGVKLADRKK